MTGAYLWSYQTGYAVVSSPTVVNGVVYIGSEDNSIYALDASSGDLVWKYTTGDQITLSSPAYADGEVYIGSNDGNIYALDATNGGLIWKYTTGGYVVGSPAIQDGVLYIGSYDHNIYALNTQNGELIWKYTTGGAVSSTAALAKGYRLHGLRRQQPLRIKRHQRRTRLEVPNRWGGCFFACCYKFGSDVWLLRRQSLHGGYFKGHAQVELPDRRQSGFFTSPRT